MPNSSDNRLRAKEPHADCPWWREEKWIKRELADAKEERRELKAGLEESRKEHREGLATLGEKIEQSAILAIRKDSANARITKILLAIITAVGGCVAAGIAILVQQ